MKNFGFGFWLILLLIVFWVGVFFFIGFPRKFSDMTPISVSLGAAAAAYFSWKQSEMAQLQFKEKFLDRRLEIIEPFAKLRSKIKIDKAIPEDLFRKVQDNHSKALVLFPKNIIESYTMWQNKVRSEMKESRREIHEGKVIFRLEDDIAKEIMASGIPTIMFMLVETGVRPESAMFD